MMYRGFLWGSSTNVLSDTAGYLESGNTIVIPTVYSDRDLGLSLHEKLIIQREKV